MSTRYRAIGRLYSHIKRLERKFAEHRKRFDGRSKGHGASVEARLRALEVWILGYNLFCDALRTLTDAVEQIASDEGCSTAELQRLVRSIRERIGRSGVRPVAEARDPRGGLPARVGARTG